MVTETVPLLKMNNKKRYEHFCETQDDLPIFYQHWYLDVVCGEVNWEVLLAEKGGKIVAVFPYFIKHLGPFSYVTMPMLCKFMGPYLIPEYRNSRHERRIIKNLIEQLPNFSYFNQSCHYDLKDWLPFHWKNFIQTTKYSYTIEGLDDLEKVLSGFVADYRNNKLKKANQLVSLSYDRSLEEFYTVSKMSFDRQKMSFPISFDFVKKYDAVLEKHQSRKIFFAVDKAGQIHSVVYLIWDERSAYFLIAGDDPKLRSSGASIFLVWEAIQFTKNTLGLDCFDFLGSMIPSIEKVRRNFGARQKPYFEIKKYNSLIFKILDQIRKH